MNNHNEDEQEGSGRASPPRAPLRAMQILAELAKAPGGLSLVRLSEQLRLPKTSVFSMLRSLEAGQYVTSQNGTHRLDKQAYNLATAIMNHDSLAARLRGPLETIQDEAHETVMLAVPSADWSRLTFADVIEGASSLRFTARAGAERPLYSTSVGLALLAFATPAQQAKYIADTKLIGLTPETITTAATLKKVLKKVREDGFVVYSGSAVGLTAIAVPIFDARGIITAAVGLAGPSIRVSEREAEFVALMCREGRKMSEILGYREASLPV